MMNEKELFYTLDGKTYKPFGTLKRVYYPRNGSPQSTKLSLNEPFRIEAKIEFVYSKEVLKSYHYMKHSKKIRTRLKHARKILKMTKGVAA